MQEDIDYIKSDVRDIKNDISDIKTTLIRNTDSLEYHVKRTDMLETKVNEIDDHVVMVNTVIKVIGAVGGMIAVFYYLIDIWQYFKK